MSDLEDFDDIASEEFVPAYDQNSDAQSEASIEEDECRICRGPEEKGRPLFSPCNCSGSIGHTHQDCLEIWLETTRGNGRCELCTTKFQFAPRYAVGTPTVLPPYEVFLGLSRRALARWLPLGIRFAAAAGLWLFVLPLATAYLYHGWMHRPSSILTRLKWKFMLGDAVSGAVIAAVIIVSFLSMMSFADFFRFHGQEGQDDRGQDRRLNARGGEQENRNAEDGHLEEEDDDDEVILDHENFARRQEQFMQPMGVMDQRQPLFAENHERGDAHRHVQWVDLPPEENIAPQGFNDTDDISEDAAEKRNELRRKIREVEALRREVDTMEEDDRNIPTQEAIGEEVRGIPLLDDVARRQLQPHEDENRVVNMMRTLQEQKELNKEEEIPQILLQGGEDRFAEMMRMQEREAEEELDALGAPELNHERGQNPEGVEQQNEPLFPQPANNEFEPQFEPLDPVRNQMDQDAEIHVALDELLGLRGPFGALLRNLLWLLAFNAVYLGIFAFIPRGFGHIACSMIFNTTTAANMFRGIPYLQERNSTENTTDFSVMGAVSALHAESLRLETTLQLPDLATVTLGYLATAIVVLLMQWGILFFHTWNSNGEQARQDNRPETRPVAEGAADEQPGGGEREREGIDHVDQIFLDGNINDIADEEAIINVGQAITTAVECIAAIVKVAAVLCLKMFALPLVLGVCLDATTLPLFGKTISDRILYAGGDFFGSILVHWVIGITFMLLVTVSVLQLREVTHPDVLAGVIRPQEPQPDLLGSLMQESGWTHTKRIVLSLGIYALLLAIHVWLPARLLASSGIGVLLPFFHPKFCHILLPQLQVPIELLIFHLSMLAFLEKYKNYIGKMQYHWLAFMCDKIGLTEQMLPRSVEKFVLVGVRPIFSMRASANPDRKYFTPDDAFTAEATATSNSSTDGAIHGENARVVKQSSPVGHRTLREVNQVDPFWYELASRSDNTDEYILSNIEIISQAESPVFQTGRKKRSGKRVLSSPQAFIRLPRPYLSREDRKRKRIKKKNAQIENNLLSTAIGSYRLHRKVQDDGTMVIEFWREIAGDQIPRPPEGWDDLGEGGAEVQGRWAWGKERKSEIEQSVAMRVAFFGGDKNWLSVFLLGLKSLLLALQSWVAVTCVVCCVLNAPLSAGRFIFYLLRIPDRFVHDPLTFIIGGCVLFPTARLVGGSLFGRKDGDSSLRRLMSWIIAFRLPPSRKLLVYIATALLWFGLSPLFLGVLYDLLLIKSREWFLFDEPFADLSCLVSSWGVGTFLLNAWASLCYIGAFTGDFWTNIGIGVLEGRPNDEQGNNAQEGNINMEVAQRPPIEAALTDASAKVDRSLWQGEHGRIARFISSNIAVLTGWEWDRVDHVIFLRECALPVVKHLGVSCLVPLTSYLLWLVMLGAMGKDAAGIVLPVVGFVDNGLYRMMIFRMLATMVLTVQLASSFQAPLNRWFHAAHQAARDDRYLIGEILLNYVAHKCN